MTTVTVAQVLAHKFAGNYRDDAAMMSAAETLMREPTTSIEDRAAIDRYLHEKAIGEPYEYPGDEYYRRYPWG